MSAILIDTNVLVYAHDRGEFAKQERAIETLLQLQLAGNGRTSTQSLAEFFQATTRGLRPKLSVAEAAAQVARLAHAWPVFEITPQIVLEATRGVLEHQFAYWDAQTWATARLNQVPVVFSEDFDVGAIIEGIRFVNPFAADFRLDNWCE